MCAMEKPPSHLRPLLARMPESLRATTFAATWPAGARIVESLPTSPRAIKKCPAPYVDLVLSFIDDDDVVAAVAECDSRQRTREVVASRMSSHEAFADAGDAAPTVEVPTIEQRLASLVLGLDQGRSPSEVATELLDALGSIDPSRANNWIAVREVFVALRRRSLADAESCLRPLLERLPTFANSMELYEHAGRMLRALLECDGIEQVTDAPALIYRLDYDVLILALTIDEKLPNCPARRVDWIVSALIDRGYAGRLASRQRHVEWLVPAFSSWAYVSQVDASSSIGLQLLAFPFTERDLTDALFTSPALSGLPTREAALSLLLPLAFSVAPEARRPAVLALALSASRLLGNREILHEIIVTYRCGGMDIDDFLGAAIDCGLDEQAADQIVPAVATKLRGHVGISPSLAAKIEILCRSTSRASAPTVRYLLGQDAALAPLLMTTPLLVPNLDELEDDYEACELLSQAIEKWMPNASVDQMTMLLSLCNDFAGSFEELMFLVNSLVE